MNYKECHVKSVRCDFDMYRSATEENHFRFKTNIFSEFTFNCHHQVSILIMIVLLFLELFFSILLSFVEPCTIIDLNLFVFMLDEMMIEILLFTVSE